MYWFCRVAHHNLCPQLAIAAWARSRASGRDKNRMNGSDKRPDHHHRMAPDTVAVVVLVGLISSESSKKMSSFDICLQLIDSLSFGRIEFNIRAAGLTVGKRRPIKNVTTN